MTEEFPAMQPIDLAAFSFVAPPAWRFYPMPNPARMVGIPMSGVGVLTVSAEHRFTVSPPPTHERCMAAAIAATTYELHGPGSDRVQERLDCCLAGGESFRTSSDFLRIWYSHCVDGLVVAWFACPSLRMTEPDVRQLVRDCDQLISSIRLAPPLA